MCVPDGCSSTMSCRSMLQIRVSNALGSCSAISERLSTYSVGHPVTCKSSTHNCAHTAVTGGASAPPAISLSIERVSWSHLPPSLPDPFNHSRHIALSSAKSIDD